ncbi:uncharacterized protein LOC112906340 [Agrilus planipennis]|uniref:Uncharacterized protein LOC112906340 n=1 Tax=Agrilus planipennis TaxID=224129 RepID=A0A7F5RJB6_AGRPL|nr:uncharacterized protein LOC112906340 [Agrilus planipennis]
MIDEKFLWKSHIQYVVNKSKEISHKIAAAARLTWGFRGAALAKIYEGAVQSAMLYGAPIWAEGCKVKECRSLLSAQRILTVKAATAYRTVPSEAAFVLSKILPFDILLQETAKRYRLFTGHPSNNDLDGLQLQDRQLERRVSLADTVHPADMDNFRFTEGVQDAYNTVIYTDGSRLDDGRAGGSFILFNGDAEIHRDNFTLAEHSTIFQCEMIALRQALTHLRGHSDIIKECSIVTDSQSVLTALRNMRQPTTLQLETWELAVNLAREISLRFHWTPSHSGNAKNDAADQLAKAAATDQATAPIYNLAPRTLVKRRLRNLFLEAWKERWRTATKGRTTASFLPDPCSARSVTPTCTRRRFALAVAVAAPWERSGDQDAAED